MVYFGQEDDRQRRESYSSIVSRAQKIERVTVVNPRGGSYKYDIYRKNVLGDGTFGSVFEGFCHTSRQTIAVKVVTKKKLKRGDNTSQLLEAKYLKAVDHFHIVKLFNTFENKHRFYMFMEKGDTTMLAEILTSKEKRFNERTARLAMRQVVDAIQYLHNHNIVHGDIKPENVLFQKRLQVEPICLAKLIDFGYARTIGNLEKRKSTKGTAYYAAPEVLGRKLHDRSIDMWSLGVLLLVSLTGKFPFTGDRKEDILGNIKEKLESWNFLRIYEMRFNLSKAAISLIKKLLEVYPERRLSATAMLDHMWFRNPQLNKDYEILKKRINRNYSSNNRARRASEKFNH